MAKAMTKEIREATVGDTIYAEDLLTMPIKLRLTAVEFLKDEVVNPANGENMDKVVFHFENGKGEKKEIGVWKMNIYCLFKWDKDYDKDEKEVEE